MKRIQLTHHEPVVPGLAYGQEHELPLASDVRVSAAVEACTLGLVSQEQKQQQQQPEQEQRRKQPNVFVERLSIRQELVTTKTTGAPLKRAVATAGKP